jgi:hypothetical protein
MPFDTILIPLSTRSWPPLGSRVRVCDLCYGDRESGLILVPGDWVVTARCDRCGTYGNPRRLEGRLLGDVQGVCGVAGYG